MKVRDVIKRLETDGWYLARTKGSHRQFKHPHKAGLVTVAGKPGVDVPAGTLKNIWRQAQIEDKELMRYGIVIEKGESSYGAYVPDLPGCVAVGETQAEVEALIREAIQFHIEGLRAEGLPVPEPTSSFEYVEV